MDNKNKHIRIEIDSNDSPEFIEIVEQIINGYIIKFKINEISVIKIKNWFDHKWLKYSGKGIIHFEETVHPDKVAITNFWKDKVTVPPFNPNRVLDELSYRKKGHNNPLFEKSLHRHQRSTENLDNFVATKSENGLILWYSSNSKINQQGSIMVYRIDEDHVDPWYVSVKKLDSWEITKTKGIHLNTLKEIIN